MINRQNIMVWLIILTLLTIAFQSQASEQKFAEFTSCQLRNSEVIAPCKIGYRTYGTLNKAKSNAVLVPTWYGGNSEGHAYLADPMYIDPSKYFVVIVDAIGNGVSVSPSTSQTQPLEKFPRFTIADMVATQHRVITETLGITRLHAIAGLSMGGMQTLQWAVQYPQATTRYAAIIGTPRLPSFDITLWTTRNILLRWYLDCQCMEPRKALAGVWMLGSVPDVLAKDVSRQEVLSKIEADAKGMTLTPGKAWDQIRQAEAMMAHNIALETADDMAKAAERIIGSVLIVTGEDDRVVTPGPAKALAGLTGATLVELDKDCGHGDPWCDAEGFGRALRRFLSQ
ncbi:alpha/beta fold hydrolase [Alteromonas sp. H39]|uniref:alpha/beta fold hydrolase n=1 Tax=Alteromonas sp. H39 TaxID=3389876 RepID=UPI0039E09CD5